MGSEFDQVHPDGTACELEDAADQLLAGRGLLGRQQGTYTETQLDRKIRLERERMPRLDECGLPEEISEYLVGTLVDELVELAHLSPIQEICYRLYAGGLSSTDLAATLGMKHQTAAVHLARAKRKVKAAYRQGRYAGWYEVYLSEVRRPAYRPRRGLRLIR